MHDIKTFLVTLSKETKVNVLQLVFFSTLMILISLTYSLIVNDNFNYLEVMTFMAVNSLLFSYAIRDLFKKAIYKK